MASGYGLNGGQGRCFPHWQGFLACYAQADEAGECRFALSDYMECLHHGAEIRRSKIVRTEMKRQERIRGVRPKTQKDMMSEVPRLNIVK